MSDGKENKPLQPSLAAAAAAVASQESTVTCSSNPLKALARAKLRLKNESDYSVSYWVVNEDKLTSMAVKRRLFRNIEDQLNDGGSDLNNAQHNAKHGWDMINAEHALDNEVCICCAMINVEEFSCHCADRTRPRGRWWECTAVVGF